MIDFPASPVAGQLFFAGNGIVYQYSSTYTSWVAISASAPQDGSFTAVSSAGAQFAPSVINTWETANPLTIQSGNAGGWYNSATGVFTPPAGRYFLWGLCSFNSSASNMLGQMRWRKNGAIIGNQADMNTAGANLYATVTDHVIVDANGTDTFDCQIQSNVLMSNASGSIGAFPINQAVVPIGGGSAWRQIARTVVAVAGPNIDFQNIPTDINDIEVHWDIIPVTNDTSMFLNFFDSTGVIDTSNVHVFSGQATEHTTTGYYNYGATSTAFNGAIILNYHGGANTKISNNASGGCQGSLWVNNIRDAAKIKSCRFMSTHLNGTATALYETQGGGRRGTQGLITGLRLSMNSGNFSVGSMATLWGSP